MPRAAPCFRRQIDLTGGLNPFPFDGRIRLFSADRDNPVIGSRVPPRGRRINSGKFTCSAVAIKAVVSDSPILCDSVILRLLKLFEAGAFISSFVLLQGERLHASKSPQFFLKHDRLLRHSLGQLPVGSNHFRSQRSFMTIEQFGQILEVPRRNFLGTRGKNGADGANPFRGQDGFAAGLARQDDDGKIAGDFIGIHGIKTCRHTVVDEGVRILTNPSSMRKDPFGEVGSQDHRETARASRFFHDKTLK